MKRSRVNENQMSFDDFMWCVNEEKPKFEWGEYITHHGRILTAEDFRNGTIKPGDLFVLDRSTQSREWYQVYRFEYRKKSEIYEDRYAKLYVTDIYCTQHHRDSISKTSISEKYSKETINHTRFDRLYLLPDDEVHGKSVRTTGPAAEVHRCPKCGTEVYRKSINHSKYGSADYVTLNIGNCRMCGCIIDDHNKDECYTLGYKTFDFE